MEYKNRYGDVYTFTKQVKFNLINNENNVYK